MKRWLWVGWWVAVAVWTVALTTTFPVHVKEALLPHDPGGVPVSKVLHVVAYAFLAGSVACLRPPGVWRWLLLILLLEHGVVTEYVQLFVPDRTGAVPDILIDHGGIALGLLLTWPWWRRSSA